MAHFLGDQIGRRNGVPWRCHWLSRLRAGSWPLRGRAAPPDCGGLEAVDVARGAGVVAPRLGALQATEASVFAPVVGAGGLADLLLPLPIGNQALANQDAVATL